MGIIIKSTGAYVPPRRISNDNLAETIDTSDEWIKSHTGISSRHKAAEDQATSDLAVFAAKTALDNAGMKAEELDMIVVATSTPDFNSFPSTASLVQLKLNAVNAGALDVGAACTGFIYALETTRGFINNGTIRNALVIGAEIMSRITDPEDRNTAVLFGDGAGAVILEESGDQRGIVQSILKADGTGEDALKVPGGGTRNPDGEKFITMDGRKVYNFAVRVNTELITALMEQHDLVFNDIEYIVPHQANERIIMAAAKRLKFPVEKFFMNLSEYANTSAATIPIALAEMDEKNLLIKGKNYILTGFGGGLTYGGTLIKW